MSQSLPLPKNSEEFPLQIATILYGKHAGAVGITFCPGKKQKDALCGAWNRSLDADLDVIEAWNASAIITLLEKKELDALSVNQLPDCAYQRGISWYHLPIADASIPSTHFERAWLDVGPRVRRLVENGSRVLVHCKGGLGRAGMIAARLLAELGSDPSNAIELVRQARPGAIETKEQQLHVLKTEPVTSATPSSSQIAVENRAVGSMMGLAIGDALGTTLEFQERDKHSRLSDIVGGGPFHLQPGQWTDDTALALALLDSLSACGGFDERDAILRFSSWYRQGKYSCTGTCFDIGHATREALTSWERSGNPLSGSINPRTAGNGSLMRLAPVVLRYWNDPKKLDTASLLQSQTTHGAPEAIDACRAYAKLIGEAISGRPAGEILQKRNTPYVPAVSAILKGSWKGKLRSEIRSSGYVIHSMEAALWCIGRTGSFAEAVLLAANLGDDADTTAAITGQLAGAIYGLDGIPQKWLRQLAWRTKIEALARTVHRQSLDSWVVASP